MGALPSFLFYIETMIETLRNNLLIFFITAIAAFAISPIVIDLLYKMQLTVRNAINKDKKKRELVNIHGLKTVIPNMGGLVVFFVVPIMIYFLVDKTSKIWVIFVGFIMLSLYGIADEISVIFARFKENLKILVKLCVIFVISLLIWYLLYEKGGLFGLYFADFRVEFMLWMIVPMALLMTVTIYGFDIYDGADGLFSGSFIINYLGLIVLLVAQNKLIYVSMLFIVVAVLAVFLYFNIPPARVRMGASGTIPVSFILFIVSILTGNLIPFFIMTVVQWIDFATSFIPIFSEMKGRKKKGKIVQLHHYFESSGWPETKVVTRFGLAVFFATLAGVLAGVYI